MNSIQTCGLRRWEDLSLDILTKIFSHVRASELSQNVSAVCRSWQLGCWYVLCCLNNELDLSVTASALGVPSSTGEHVQSLMDVKLMELLTFVLEDNNDLSRGWRLSVRTVSVSENIRISDVGLIYIAERTTRLENLNLMGASRVTARGFAKAICYWRNVKAIELGKIKPENLTQIIEVVAKNCLMLEEMSLIMYDFHVNRGNAFMIVRNLRQIRTLKLEGATIHRDGMWVLLRSVGVLNEIQLRRCFLEDEEFPLSIDFNLSGRKWYYRKSEKSPAGFEWGEWMENAS